MTSVGIRELKDNLSEYVRRAEAGEDIVVMVRDRAVAELGPIGKRKRTTSEDFNRMMAGRFADPGLLKELKELQPDTTDDLDY
jgi:prevent-host-death family protein